MSHDKIEGDRIFRSLDFASDEIRAFYFSSEHFGEDGEGYIYDREIMEYVDEQEIEDEMIFQRETVVE